MIDDVAEDSLPRLGRDGNEEHRAARVVVADVVAVVFQLLALAFKWHRCGIIAEIAAKRGSRRREPASFRTMHREFRRLFWPCRRPCSVAQSVEIEVPTAAEDLEYDGTEQTGVAEGEGYTLANNTAKDAGDYTATATLKDGYCWKGGDTEPKQIAWSIAKKDAMVTPNSSSKKVGEDDPEWQAHVDGVVAGEELNYTLEREKGETAGEYAINVVLGDNPNYNVNWNPGKFTIEANEITITVTKGEGIASVMVKVGDNDPIDADGEVGLPADTEKVTITLTANDMTIPVFKNYDAVVAKSAEYNVADKATFSFTAEEAEEDDDKVTPEQRKQAILDAIDPALPDNPDDAERYQKAVDKVNAVVGDGDGQVPAKDLAAYIKENGIRSQELGDSEYVAASVKLDTDSLIDEDTEVKIATLDQVEGGAMTFAVSIDGDEVEVAAIKDMVEASSDLSAWAANKLEVEAEFDAGKVTITPKTTTNKAFMKVVIPKDPVK